MQIFYQLDTNKNYSVLGGGSNLRFYILIISFSSSFIALNTFFLIHAYLSYREIGVLIAGLFLYSIGLFFLGYGIFCYRKNKKQIYKEKRIISTGVLTEGIIIKSAVSSYLSSSNSNRTYQHIFDYEFNDQNNVLRNGKIIFRSQIRQNIDVGRKVMVCFNETESLILKQYVILSEEKDMNLATNSKEKNKDERKFIQDNSIKVDKSKRILTYEIISFYLISGLTLSIIGLGITSLVFILAVIPFDNFAGRSIVFLIVDCILFSVTVIPGIVLICTYIKKRRNNRKFFQNCLFTYGTVHPNKVYSMNDRFLINYSYIDNNGKEIFAQFRTLADITIPKIIVVAYTDKDSVLIRDCEIIND